MASSTIVLKDKADANITYSLVGQTAQGAVYRNADRALNKPQSLEFQSQIGNPGAKGNDRINITLKNSVQNATTGIMSTGSVKITLSLPRDDEWTVTDSENLLIQLQDLFTDANAAIIVDAMIP